MPDSLPQFGFGLVKRPDGKHQIILEILTGFTKFEVYIGDASNYMQNAKVIHEGLISVGKEAARADSGLVVMDGMNGGDVNAIVQAQRRQSGAKGRKGS